MAGIVQGTAHLYGIQGGVGVIANATVLDFSTDSSRQNTASTTNEIGNEIERRYDDLVNEGTLTLQPRSGFTEFVVGDTITYDGVEYEITSEGRKETAKGFVTLTYNFKKSEYITYAP